tara:strand:+ start:555 stop:857 length:303 start_codon:yes stop_codon:yes gene_type:complete
MRSRTPPPFIIRIRFGGRGGDFTVSDEFLGFVWFWGIKPGEMAEFSFLFLIVLSASEEMEVKGGETSSFFPSLRPIKNTNPKEKAQGNPILRKIRIFYHS